MKNLLKIALWVLGGAALVVLVLFVGALFERQAQLAELSEEDKAELRQKLVDGELQGDGVMDDVWEDSGASSTVAGVVAQLKNPRVQRYGAIALAAVLLAALASRLLRYARGHGERERKQQAEAELDQALARIEDDLTAPGPGARRGKGAAGAPAAAAVEPFWARWRKKKPAASADEETERMPWETAEDAGEGPSGGGPAVTTPVPSVELESYSARGKPSRQIDRPAEKLARGGTLPGLELPAPDDRPRTPDPQRAAAVSGTSASTPREAAPATTHGGGGFRPRDLEAAHRLLSKHMTTCLAERGAGLGIDRAARLVAVAEASVRAHPKLDDPRRAHLPVEVRLALRLAEEVGRQSRPGEDRDADLAKAMVDVMMRLKDEGAA